MSNSQKLSYTSDVSISFITQVLVCAIAAVTSIIVSRVLGPSGKGIYSLAVTIPTIVAMLSTMGMNSASVYLLGKKTGHQGSILGNVLVYSLAAGTLISGLCFALMPFWERFFLHNSPPVYLYLALPLIPFLMVFDNISYTLLGHRDMFKYGLFNLINPVFYFALLLIFYFLGALDVTRAIWAYIFGVVVSICAGLFMLFKNGYAEGLSLDKGTFVKAAKFGIKQHLGTIFQFLNYRLDFLIIAVFLAPSEVGLYSVAVLIGETIWYIPNALGQVLYPQTISSDKKTADSFTPLVCRNTVIFTLVPAVILYLISGSVIPWLFTDRFLPSVTALKLLLPGIVALSIGKILSSDLVGRGYPYYSSFVAFVALIFTVIFDILLIPRFGINGAAVASSISYISSACTIMYLFHKTTGISVKDTLIFKRRDSYIYLRIFSFLKNIQPGAKRASGQG